jgi:hypothetical protein
MSPSVFEKMRLLGTGAPFVKTGNRCVYDVRDLNSWMESRKVRSTSAAGQPMTGMGTAPVVKVKAGAKPATAVSLAVKPKAKPEPQPLRRRTERSEERHGTG